jgi:hypothetical protein
VSDQARLDGPEKLPGSNIVGLSTGMGPERSANIAASCGARVLYKTAGEMALQGFSGSHATSSAPQKLVQLVGYRDPNVQPDLTWRRPRQTGSR